LKQLVRLMALGASLAVTATAGSIYFQGFETDRSGWTPDTSGSTAGTITRVANGDGTLHLIAPDGTHYAEVTNSDDAYPSGFTVGQPGSGYGTGGYSLFGTSAVQPYPGSPFTQSIDVYIDPTLTATSPSVPAFWIDAAPTSTDPNGNTYAGEHNFQLLYNSDAVTVNPDNGAKGALTTITNAGWYNFQFLYSQSDANPTDTSDTTLSVFNDTGTLLGSQTLTNDVPVNGTLQNQYLGGVNYIWLPVWQNGFSNDTLGIDDVSADTVTPEPSSIILFGAGFAVIGLFARRRRLV